MINNYKEAYKEVLEVLKYVPADDVKKIFKANKFDIILT